MKMNPFFIIFRPLTAYMLIFLLILTFAAWAVAGEHFKPTIRILYQWIHSSFVGKTDDLQELVLQYHANHFFAKTAAIFLTGSCVLVFTTILFGPLLVQMNTLNELSQEKSKLTISYREFIKKQTESKEHLNTAHEILGQHRSLTIQSMQQAEDLDNILNSLPSKLENISAWLDHIHAQQLEHTKTYTSEIAEQEQDQGDF